MTISMQGDIVAVLGATGQQGGAVVDALLDRSVRVRAVVRDPSSAASRRLAGRGVEVVEGDQERTVSLRDAFAGIGALFAMTTFGGSDGVAGEVRRGTAVADAARDVGVPLVVYSSVGGAERGSGIPHFESKRQVEEHLFEVLPEVRIVRPTYFMDNLVQYLPDAGDSSDVFVLPFPMPVDAPLQMVAVRDIGIVSASLLLDLDALGGQTVEIGGDERTPARIAEAIGVHLGRPARAEQVPFSSLPTEDLQRMFRWFSETLAYDADFAATRRLDPEVLDLPAWLRDRSA